MYTVHSVQWMPHRLSTQVNVHKIYSTIYQCFGSKTFLTDPDPRIHIPEFSELVINNKTGNIGMQQYVTQRVPKQYF